MSLIDSISVDVWMYSIFPYLLTSDQYVLSQACCVKAGQSSPDAPTCSDDTVAPSAKGTNRNGTTAAVSLKPYLSTSQILSRTQKRLVMNFHASSFEIARHFQLQEAEVFNLKPADQSSERNTEQRLKEALKVNGSNLQRLVNNEMQPKSRTTEPLALNAEYLFTNGIHWACLSGRPAENEDEESYCSFFYPDSYKQLKCGLVLPTETFHTIATHLSASTETPSSSSPSDDSCSASSPSSASSSAVAAATSHAAVLASVRIIAPFETAMQRLLPIQRALVSMNAQWCYLNGPDSPDYDMWKERVGGFHITPFVVPWPRSAKEFIEAMREFQTDENQFAVFGDDPSNDLSHVRPCGGESYTDEVPPAYPHLNGWICSHECADTHSWMCGLENCICCQESSPRMHRACLCHTQVLRGCVWWHCERATHWVRRLLLKRLGVDVAVQGAGIGVSLRARVRPGWGDFFAVNPAPPQVTLNELPDREAFQPIDPSSRANILLQEAMPWSIDISGPQEQCTPALGLVAAPLSSGWVGGFLATTVNAGV